jgi:non-ribosomal peptide synthase protein (TIGR01720 family)
VELLPIQRWYLGLGEPYDHGNLAGLLRVPTGVLDPDVLAQAFRTLAVHHDALRMRFEQIDGPWTQRYGDLAAAEVPVHVVDLRDVPERERHTAVETTCIELQTSLDITHGPVDCAALIELGDESRLFVVLHHLVVDSHSLHILIEDLQTIYAGIVAGVPVQLPPKTTSLQEWARRVQAHTATEAVRDELAFWRAQMPRRPLPLDFPDGRNTGVSERQVDRALSAADTAALLHDVHTAYGTQTWHLLLTALARVLNRWSPEILVWLESQERDERIAEDVDLSRTVGWLTCVFPILLAVDEAADDGEAIRIVMAQLDAVSGVGGSYGQLWSLERPDRREGLPSPRHPGVTFNYVGRFDTSWGPSSLFSPADEPCGPSFGPREERSSAIAVNAAVVTDSLTVAWVYSENLHCRSTIEALADDYMAELRRLIQHCLRRPTTRPDRPA